MATSVGGITTGEGGDDIVIDDPHNVVDGESEAIREGTNQWYDEAISTRLNDRKTSTITIIMQRVHEMDLIGNILERKKEQGWTVVCLPMEYEGENRIQSPLGWTDPRTKIGELLWPERYDAESLADLKASFGGPYARDAQLQQRPVPRGTGIIDTKKIELLESYDYNNIESAVRYWDKAATEKGGCQTAGALLGITKQGRIIILDMRCGQWGIGQRNPIIKQTAKDDYDLFGSDRVFTWLEQEPGSGGKESGMISVADLSGYRVRLDRPTGDKVYRADPFADQVAGGNVACLNRTWTKKYLEEVRKFPFGAMKDQVDATSGAYNRLVLASRGGTF